ncbi:hypothetical protein H5410_060987 [Solanum commersonii]|uniref:Uncharacterized protein n=1 Tax=Solanum commersonii TaxID=4109 RepID=A0A9J5W6I1_SOLCO|nr:hypothetical protein H5410_060987 [Solanum commersonii]
MNAHNKTQFTYARINCVLKDSSCNTSLPKILMVTVYASNASSSSTIFKASESDATLTLTKKNTMQAFTHWFARIFQSTFVSAPSRSKRCSGDVSKLQNPSSAKRRQQPQTPAKLHVMAITTVSNNKPP